MSQFVPFDHRPSATGQSSTSYTVASGKYARVVLSYSVVVTAATGDTTGTVSSIAAYNTNPQSCTGTLELWLKAADALTVSTSIASTSATLVAAGAGYYWDTTSDSSTVTVSVNATAIALFKATGTISMAANFAGASTISMGVFTGAADYRIHYEEYDV